VNLITERHQFKHQHTSQKHLNNQNDEVEFHIIERRQ